MDLRDRLLQRMSSVPALDRHNAHGDTVGGADPGEEKSVDTRVLAVHRVAAVLVSLVILVFGILGFADDLSFFSTEGEPVLGISSNGLLSAISVLTAAVLFAAAVRGPRMASTVMMAVGTLFLLSALLNLAVLQTSFNILAFRMSNVIFSVVTGLWLLVLGAYGRVSGHLPADSPYARDRETREPDPPEEFAVTPDQAAAEHAMRAAEIAVVQHMATADQRRRVAEMARVHSRGDRRRVWMSFDATSS